MSKNILALVGALAIVVLIGGAAYKTFGPPSPVAAPAFQQTPPRAISQIPVTQYFAQTYQNIGHLGVGAILPQGLGLAISSISLWGFGNEYFAIEVDGVIVYRIIGGSSAAAVPFSIDPPIIVPPAHQVRFGPENTTGRHFSVSGYVLNASDFGL